MNGYLKERTPYGVFILVDGVCVAFIANEAKGKRK
jgi:hypothetical protein